ncbi:Calx-beta domain-containing protein, partial [Flagellimonas amphidinii]
MLPFLKRIAIPPFSNYGQGRFLFFVFTLFCVGFGYGQEGISISDVTLDEGDSGTTDFVFTVSVDGGGNASSNIDFDYTTSDGTATVADGDYDLEAGSGQITAGSPSTTITVTVNGDTDVELDEGFTVELSNYGNISDGTGAGTINNDDSVTVEFSQATGSDAENTGG